MKIIDQPLPGALLLEPKMFADHRGDFVKTFHVSTFAQWNIKFQPVEEFFSTSYKNVIRGMHVQLPPHDHDKLVYCIRGRVLDVLLDLRRQLPTYGTAVSAELSEKNRRLFFIPRGVAHGFLSLEEPSVMVYQTSTVHAPDFDSGIRWDSFGFNWGTSNPICSSRDVVLSGFANFVSPF